MTIRKTMLALSLLLVTGQAFFAPAPVNSQCNVTATGTYDFTTMKFVTKTLSASTMCQTTAMNAFSCFPGAAPFFTNKLYAVALSATVNPYCNWSCGCGTGALPHVTIDGSDGLPVELMDFSVE